MNAPKANPALIAVFELYGLASQEPTADIHWGVYLLAGGPAAHIGQG
jgi:hypothetical protein